MKMIKKRWTLILMLLLVMLPAIASAYVDGVTGTTFNLVAKDGRIIMGDGTSAYIWGYAVPDARMTGCPAEGCVQYPGPTLIVNQGDAVTVTLKNSIPLINGNVSVPNVSIVFPGQIVTAAGGVAGLITREARANGTDVVTYTFTASNPGTYTYYSGTGSDLEVEMGLIGTLIVRPKNGVNGCVLPARPSHPAIKSGLPQYAADASLFSPIPSSAAGNVPSASRGFAYCTVDSYYDHEYLFLITEIDPAIHRDIELGQMSQVDTTDRHPTAWFINGRNFPDTQADAYAPWLPNQPYNAMPLVHPGEAYLIRFVGGGQNLHPMHAHGQNHTIIARDARLLQSPAGAALVPNRVDLPISDYTTTTVPGETADAIWGPWTGEKLNWDIYGHTDPANTGKVGSSCAATLAPGEYIADHCKPFPVELPAPTRLTFGQMWGGTPYLGIPGYIPPIDPNTGDYHSNQNPMAAQGFMFHSHNEREITTNNIFIGGAATMTMVMPYQNADGTPNVIP